MLGFYATADCSKPIRTDLDNELEGEFPIQHRSFNADAPYLRRQVVYP